MTRKNAQTLVVIAAALVVGVAAWFADDLAGYWRAARPPAGYQGGAGGGSGAAASPRVEPPSQAFVPPFEAEKMTNTELLAHYVKQVPLDKSPTLDEWQKLLDELPKELLGGAGGEGGTGGTGGTAGVPVTLPLGRGHFVMAMCADLAGNLWVGTEGEGLFRYNPSKPAAEQWAQFTTKDGLGDDYVYALACDLQGRIWAGHLNHGVSVYNGERFQLYEVVGGLNRPDSLNGALGERIFKIAVAPDYSRLAGADRSPTFHDALTDKDSPMAGSVWMASSAGLAIYFPATDTWSYVTRAEGLPSDQANAISFDRDGTVYIGTQCDGIAIAGPQDHYATWKQVTAANPTPHAVDGKIVDVPVPVAGKGTGLPTDLINDLLVAKDGTVYAATTLGLSWSTDHGNSWQYVRGADWPEKVQNRLGGAPQGWQPPTDADKGGVILAEDYTTTLAEDVDGNLLAGHRAAAGDILAPQARKKIDSSANLCITSFVSMPGTKNAFRGTYGDGMSVYNADKKAPLRLLADQASLATLKLPASAAPPSADELERFMEKATPLSAANSAATAILGEDWITRGDSVGRYGRQYWVLCAGSGATDDIFFSASGFSVTATIDPQYRGRDSRRNWVEGYSTDNPGSLWDCFIGSRRQAEWDDHGESYATAAEGPDLWLSTRLPEGLFRVSLYFFPFRGHEHANSREFRDLVLEVGIDEGPDQPLVAGAKSRVENFQGGVYKQFLLQGGQRYRLLISRNFSYNAIVSGVFIDRLSGPKSSFESVFLPVMGTFRYDTPAISSASMARIGSVNLGGAWASLVTGPPESAAFSRFGRVMLYRAVESLRAPTNSLSGLRWSLPLWSSADRADWNRAMQEAYASFLKLNPGHAHQVAKSAAVGATTQSSKK